jgi:GNAT superfamily N-acetyltransferase
VHSAFQNYLNLRVPNIQRQQREEINNYTMQLFGESVKRSVDNEGGVQWARLQEELMCNIAVMNGHTKNTGRWTNIVEGAAKAKHVIDQALSGGIIAWFGIKTLMTVATTAAWIAAGAKGATTPLDTIMVNFADPYSVAVLGGLIYGKVVLGVVSAFVPDMANKESEEALSSKLPSVGKVLAGLGAWIASYNIVSGLYGFEKAATTATEVGQRWSTVLNTASHNINSVVGGMADPATHAWGVVLAAMYAGIRPLEVIARKFLARQNAISKAYGEVLKAIDAIAPPEDFGGNNGRNNGAPAQEDNRISFVNLADMYCAGKLEFEGLFSQGQEINEKSFDPDKIESRETLMTYFEGMKADRTEGAENYGRDAYAYIVPVLGNGMVGGMFSFDLLAPEQGDRGVMFDGYLAVREDLRGMGLGKMLFREGLAVAVEHARANGYGIRYVFGEADVPVDAETATHARVIGSIRNGAVPCVQQPDGSYKIIYYAQPGQEAGAEEVPMMPVFSIVENGQLGRMPEALPAEEVLGVLDRIMESYSTAPYAVPEQIEGIRNAYRASVGNNAFVTMRPAAEAIGLDQDSRR